MTSNSRLRSYFGVAVLMLVSAGIFIGFVLRNGLTLSHRPFSAVEPPLKNYMLALRFREQLTMGVIHFHQFLNLVNDWNFTGVEPFIYRTGLWGTRSLVKYASVTFRFSKLFNATLHNDYLSECMGREKDPEMGTPVLFESMTKFLHHSYRDVVIVHFESYPQTLSNQTWKIGIEKSLSASPDAIQECTEAAKKHGLASEVEKVLSREIKIEKVQTSDSLPHNIDMFRVVQTFCIKKSVRISLHDLRDFILNHIYHKGEKGPEVSILFLVWSGRFTQPLVESDVSNYINECRLPFSQPYHSDEVTRATDRFISSLGLKDLPYIAVHIRFEKVYIYAQKKNYPLDKYVKCCVKRLNYVLDQVRMKHKIPAKQTLLVWDYSPYGSDSCPLKDKNCKRVTEPYVKQINATPSYFDPKSFDVPHHIGLISLVESHSLYGGEVLVTVGEGSYQYTVVQTFIEHHRDLISTPETAAKELHHGHLCIPPEELNGIEVPQDSECMFGT